MRAKCNEETLKPVFHDRDQVKYIRSNTIFLCPFKDPSITKETSVVKYTANMIDDINVPVNLLVT